MDIHDSRGKTRLDIADLKLMRTFQVLIQERSVSRTAQRLNLGQPTISHALAKLRLIFDDPLFIRTSGAMAPTARCLELQGHVERLLADFDQLLEPPGSFDPSKSRLRIAIMAPEFASDLIGPPLLKRLEGQSANVEVVFMTTDPIEAMDQLEQGAIDFRLGWWPQPAPTLRSKLMWTDELCCILRQGHPYTNVPLTAERYFDGRHVRVRRLGRSYSMASIDSAAAKAGKAIQVAAWVQNAHIMAATVASTNMIGTLSERLAATLSHLSIQRRPLPLEIPKLKIALYWHERTHRSPAHKWFRSQLFGAAKAV